MIKHIILKETGMTENTMISIPRHPTPEMTEAAYKAFEQANGQPVPGGVLTAWAAMLKAYELEVWLKAKP